MVPFYFWHAFGMLPKYNIKTEIHYHVNVKGSRYLNNPDIDFLNDKINC